MSVKTDESRYAVIQFRIHTIPMYYIICPVDLPNKAMECYHWELTAGAIHKNTILIMYNNTYRHTCTCTVYIVTHISIHWIGMEGVLEVIETIFIF